MFFYCHIYCLYLLVLLYSVFIFMCLIDIISCYAFSVLPSLAVYILFYIYSFLYSETL